MLGRKYSTQKHSDPLQAAGISTKKEDSETLFFGIKCKKEV